MDISKYGIINIIQRDFSGYKIVMIAPYACGNANIIPCIVYRILMNNEKPFNPLPSRVDQMQRVFSIVLTQHLYVAKCLLFWHFCCFT